MMNSANEMMQMAPQMMGCCPLFGGTGWLFAMATPLIVVGAIVYLLTKRSETTDYQDNSLS
tara:strand:+ start:400 stop:582 length:183 start_codon:yes stop_codon:yes gene_type:complete